METLIAKRGARARVLCASIDFFYARGRLVTPHCLASCYIRRVDSCLKGGPAMPFVTSPLPQPLSSRRLWWVAAGFVGAAAGMALRNHLDARAQRESRRGQGHPQRDAETREQTATSPSPSTEHAAQPSADRGIRELSAFLAGETWLDEHGWRGVWEREGVSDVALWLREDGVGCLRAERVRLQEQPALLAGCRRRWIVVCRYAGVEVGEAAAWWNQTDAEA